MSQNYLINTREMAAQALRRNGGGEPGAPGNELIPCRIIAANGAGYDVQTLDDQGEMGRIYERIFPFPDAELSADQEAWLWFPADGETPLIFVSGGGGGGCQRAVTEWGVPWS